MSEPAEPESDNVLSVIVRLVRWARDNPDNPYALDARRIVEEYWTATGVGAYVVGAPHAHPMDCPTYYDGCNCTVETIEGFLKDLNDRPISDSVFLPMGQSPGGKGEWLMTQFILQPVGHRLWIRGIVK